MEKTVQNIDETQNLNFDQLEKSTLLKYNAVQDGLAKLQKNYNSRQWNRIKNLFDQYTNSVYALEQCYKNLGEENMDYESVIFDFYTKINEIEYELSQFAIKSIPSIKVKKPTIHNPFASQITSKGKPSITFNFGSGVSVIEEQNTIKQEGSIGYLSADMLSKIDLITSFGEGATYGLNASYGPISGFIRKSWDSSDIFLGFNENQLGVGTFLNLNNGLTPEFYVSTVSIPGTIFTLAHQGGAFNSTALSGVQTKTSLFFPIGTITSAVYTVLKRLHEWTGLFSFMFSDGPKVLENNEKKKLFTNDDAINVYSDLINLLSGSDSEKMLSELSILVQYENLPTNLKFGKGQQSINLKAMVHLYYTKILINLTTSDELRLDEAKQYSQLPLAIPFSPIEQVNINAALDSMGVINASGWSLTRIMGLNQNSNPWVSQAVGLADGGLGALGLSITELSIGIPIGIKKHGIKFWKAFSEDVKWYNPLTWLTVAKNIWDYFSPVYDRRDERKVEIVNRVQDMMEENNRLMQIPLNQLDSTQIQKVFSNLLYLQNYFGSKEIAIGALGDIVTQELKEHLNEFGKNYALICCKAIPKNDFYDSNIYPNDYLKLSTILIESILFLDQQKVDNKEQKIINFAAKHVEKKHSNDYRAALYLFSSPVESRHHSLRANLVKLLKNENLTIAEHQKLFVLISETIKYSSVSPIIAEKYAEVLSSLNDEIEDAGVRYCELIQAEFEKDFGSMNPEKIKRLIDSLEILLILNPDIAKKANAICIDEVEIKMEQLQTKFDQTNKLSKSEFNFLSVIDYIYRNNINLKEIALFGNRASDDALDLYKTFAKLATALTSKKNLQAKK